MAGPLGIQAEPQDVSDPQAGSARAAAFDPFYAEQAETTQQQQLAQQIRAAALQQLQGAGKPITIQGPVGPMTTGMGAGAALMHGGANLIGLGMEQNAIKRQSALNQQRFEMMDKDIQQGMDLLGSPPAFESEHRPDFTVDDEAVARNNILHKQWQKQLLKHAGHLTAFYGDLPGAKEAAAALGSVGAKENAITKMNDNTYLLQRPGVEGHVALKANSPLLTSPNQMISTETNAGIQPNFVTPSGPITVAPGNTVFGGTGLGGGFSQPTTGAAPSQPGDVSSPTGAPTPGGGMNVLQQGVIQRAPHPMIKGVSVDVHDPANPAKFVNTATGQPLNLDATGLNHLVRQSNTAEAAAKISDDKTNFVNIYQVARQSLASMHALGSDRVADIAFLRQFDREVNAPLARVPMMTHGEQEALDTVRDKFANLYSKFVAGSGAMSETTREQFLQVAKQLTSATLEEANRETRAMARRYSVGLPEHAVDEGALREMVMLPPAEPPRPHNTGHAPAEGAARPSGHAAKPVGKDPAAQWKMVPK